MLQVIHPDVMDSQKFWTMACIPLTHYPKDFSFWPYILLHPLMAKLSFDTYNMCRPGVQLVSAPQVV